MMLRQATLFKVLYYTVRQNKVASLKFFAIFLATVRKFYFEISQFYFLKCFTSNRQVKCDAVEIEKRQCYRLLT